MSVEQYLTFDDLPGVDSSPNDVREKFKELYKELPAGIALNKTTYFNAVTPAITETNGRYCYKRLGICKFTSDGGPQSKETIIGSSTAVNKGDTKVTMALGVQGGWYETVRWSSSITDGLSFSGAVTIEGVFEMGMGFSLSTTSEESNSKRVTKSTTVTVTVEVPARSKVKVNMVATMKKEALNFKVPIEVDGWFGANFPDRVEDHYFWFVTASKLLPKTSGEISGVVYGTSYFDANTVVEKAEKI